MDTDSPIAAPVRIRRSQWRDLASLSARKSVARAESRLVADELRGHVHFRPGGAASCLLARGSSALFLCCRSQPCSEVESHLFNLWLHSYICIASYRDKCVGLMGGHGGVRRVGYRHAEQLKVAPYLRAICGGWNTEFRTSTWSRCPCLGCILVYDVAEALLAASRGCVEVYFVLVYLSPNMNIYVSSRL